MGLWFLITYLDAIDKFVYCCRTRAVQKLIETLKTPQQVSMVISALKPGVMALIKDLNGNHVVQRCLQYLSNEENQVILPFLSRKLSTSIVH